uniref:Oligopeptide transporter 1 n=1 Tax=Steinernema glaseri TaxID=37863 RepID=A0A1I8AW98_9BILA
MPDQEREGLLDSFDGESEVAKHTALEPEPQGFKEMYKKWPKATFCIVGNEFCERFSYYGMRAVLTLYLLNILQFDNDNATVLYHGFTVIAYASSLLGSILADGYIGKFWTIFFVSILYACGNVMLAVSSTFDKTSHIHPYLDFAALIVIGLGTGGIKPCVSSFGADQFPSHHTKMISIFFSVFYFTVNAGSTISMALTPIFRTLPCMGHDSCYPLAFGVPAALMVLSTVLFMIGSVSYKKVPPKENTIKLAFVTICGAAFNFFWNWKTKREHWMDHCLDNHKCENDPKCMALAVKGKRIGEKCAQQKFADDCKSLVRVTVMMLPVPMFWALYDQQGSRWLLQAVEMDSEIWPGFSVLPDQMAIVNAILILAFIPIFQSVIYPLVEKCGIRATPLRKMIVGGLLAALSFAVCGFVQLRVNQTLPDVPPSNTAFVSIINVFPNCNVSVGNNMIGGIVSVPANNSLIEDKVKKIDQLYRFNVGSKSNVTFTFTYNGAECFGYADKPHIVQKEFEGGKTYYIATTPQGLLSDTSSLDKPQEGEGESSVSLDFLLPCSSLPPNVTWGNNCNETDNTMETSYNGTIAACEISDRPHCDPRNKLYGEWKHGKHVPLKSLHSNASVGTRYGHQDLKPGTYQLFYLLNNQKPGVDRTPAESELQFAQISDVVLKITGQGGVYTLTVAKDGNLLDLTVKKNVFNVHTVVPKNHVNIVWQLPQYVIITAAEILFSITGLEFSYGQAAPSLKSVVTAIWLITVAVGDMIIIIIDKIVKIDDLAVIMFVFGAAMVVVIGVFTLMSIFYYEYVDYSTAEEEDSQDNHAYEEVDEPVKL